MERTGTATLPFVIEGVATTPTAVPKEDAGRVLLEEAEGLATTVAWVLVEVGEVMLDDEAPVERGNEEVAATPAAVLVERVLDANRLAEAEALDVYEAKMAELADSASVTGQIVYKLSIPKPNYSRHTYRIDCNSVRHHHHICSCRVACRTVRDACSTACNGVGDLSEDSQSCLSGRISRRRVRLTTRMEVMSRMLVSGGQGGEEGHRESCVLHSGYDGRLGG